MQMKVICMDIIGIYYNILNQELPHLHFPRSEWDTAVVFDAVCIPERVEGVTGVSVNWLPLRMYFQPVRVMQISTKSLWEMEPWLAVFGNKDMQPYAALRRCCPCQERPPRGPWRPYATLAVIVGHPLAPKARSGCSRLLGNLQRRHQIRALSRSLLRCFLATFLLTSYTQAYIVSACAAQLSQLCCRTSWTSTCFPQPCLQITWHNSCPWIPMLVWVRRWPVTLWGLLKWFYENGMRNESSCWRRRPRWWCLTNFSRSVRLPLTCSQGDCCHSGAGWNQWNKAAVNMSNRAKRRNRGSLTVGTFMWP